MNRRLRAAIDFAMMRQVEASAELVYRPPMREAPTACPDSTVYPMTCASTVWFTYERVSGELSFLDVDVVRKFLVEGVIPHELRAYESSAGGAQRRFCDVQQPSMRRFVHRSTLLPILEYAGARFFAEVDRRRALHYARGGHLKRSCPNNAELIGQESA